MLTDKNRHNGHRILWVTRSFLDYRVPVYTALDKLLGGKLYVLYSRDVTPERCWRKLEESLGDRAIGLSGEKSVGYKGNITGEIANSTWRIPYQPGLLKKIKELQPDVVLGDGFFQWTWPAMLHRLTSGTPLVVCYERTHHTERNAQWYRTLFRKVMIRFIGAMSVNGRLSREYVQSLGIPPDKITTGHMVADTDSLAQQVGKLGSAESEALKTALGIPAGSTVFLSVCQLIKRKGLDYLLRGWQRFQGSGTTNSVLLIVGDGPEQDALRQFCRDQTVEGVIFAGAVDYDEIYRYFALANVFVISTLEDNWSLVVPEAMACGKPVLCSQYNGCWPELIQEGKNGWVFDPKDIRNTTKAFQQCLDTPHLPQMGEKSRQIVSAHTAQHAAQAVLDACRLAIN